MKKSFRKWLSLALVAALSLLAQGALAESLSLEGTVAASEATVIYAPIGGMVAEVMVQAGQHVNEGDVLAVLETTKVYAEEAGTIAGVFGQPGDAAETVSDRYGAVMYIEGACVYTISASTNNAYNTEANKFVHTGEEVYLSCYSDASHTGTGVVTSVSGTDFTVEVLSGTFLIGESVNVFRGDKAASSQRIGRGTLSRRAPTAVTASGSIVSVAVQDGSYVKKGDLLLETLDGAFDGLYMSGKEIRAAVSGVVAQIGMEEGAQIEKGAAVATLYPDGAMRVESKTPETDLSNIHAGDAVSVELLWNEDSGKVYPGIVTMISAIAEESQQESGDETVYYAVYVDFTPDENTRYGMRAVITTVDALETAGASND